jgi:hypothetical protein
VVRLLHAAPGRTVTEPGVLPQVVLIHQVATRQAGGPPSSDLPAGDRETDDRASTLPANSAEPTQSWI